MQQIVLNSFFLTNSSVWYPYYHKRPISNSMVHRLIKKVSFIFDKTEQNCFNKLVKSEVYLEILQFNENFQILHSCFQLNHLENVKIHRLRYIWRFLWTILEQKNIENYWMVSVRREVTCQNIVANIRTFRKQAAASVVPMNNNLTVDLSL